MRSTVLENIATHPDYRRQGLASRLIKWSFDPADKKGVIVYLDTATDGKALGLYESLGFVQRGESTIPDLSVYGGDAEAHTHVGMVREPTVSS